MCLVIEHRAVRSILTMVVLASIAACGSGGNSMVLSVGGTYQTQVTLTGNTCGSGIQVQNNPTVVSHTPGSASLSLTHAQNTYQGSIDVSAAFSTTPRTISTGGSQSTISIGGLFNRTGFDAIVNVDVTQQGPPPNCAYTVHWVGTKDGSPNTIP